MKIVVVYKHLLLWVERRVRVVLKRDPLSNAPQLDEETNQSRMSNVD